ncbi:MAG: hypothetical protein ACYSOF_05575 [Planctomycetota bacterium]|jgi:hypothetical protein
MKNSIENHEDVEEEPEFNLETVERVIWQLEHPSGSGMYFIRHAIICFIHSIGTRVSCLLKEKDHRIGGDRSSIQEVASYPSRRHS